MKIIPVRDVEYNLIGELTFALVDNPESNEDLVHMQGIYALWENLKGSDRVMFAKRHFIHHKCFDDEREMRLFAPFMVSDDQNMYRICYERLMGRWRMIRLPARYLKKDDGRHLFQCPTLSPLSDVLN